MKNFALVSTINVAVASLKAAWWASQMDHVTSEAACAGPTAHHYALPALCARPDGRYVTSPL